VWGTGGRCAVCPGVKSARGGGQGRVGRDGRRAYGRCETWRRRRPVTLVARFCSALLIQFANALDTRRPLPSDGWQNGLVVTCTSPRPAPRGSTSSNDGSLRSPRSNSGAVSIEAHVNWNRPSNDSWSHTTQTPSLSHGPRPRMKSTPASHAFANGVQTQDTRACRRFRGYASG
jgi:hypothetical protein